MHARYHLLYIAASFVAALTAAVGVVIEAPVCYAIVPGILGGTCALAAAVRFLKYKVDLAGFVATTCGFVFYQAFQANPVTLPDFTAALAPIAPIDQVVGIALGNLTTALLLISHHAVSLMLKRPIRALVPSVEAAHRARIDRYVLPGFLVVFVVVAIPHVLFGQVVLGAIKSILYQRAAWGAPGEFSGFDTGGGPVGASLLNMTFWATSLFLLWVYLIGSRQRTAMLLLSPLVLLWTAGVALQGSRTYFVMLGFGLIIYLLGSARRGGRAFLYATIGLPLGFVLLQVTALFRTEGLQAVNLGELGTRFFEIRGHEGTASQMDGLEFFRTEFVAKEAAPNPALGFLRGLIERPIEGLLMPVPRALFPWKPVDDTAREFTLFFQNVRLGVPSQETFLGASPGLMGRELIRYGYFGPVTVLFWLGLVIALADRLYVVGATSDFHRIFATVLVAFAVAQMRDWVPMWFLPFLPAMAILGFAARRVRRIRLAERAVPLVERAAWQRT